MVIVFVPSRPVLSWALAGSPMLDGGGRAGGDGDGEGDGVMLMV